MEPAVDTKAFTTPFYRDVFSVFVAKGAYIFDVECGYGRTLRELHGLGFTNLHGIDSSEKMIDHGLDENSFLVTFTIMNGHKSNGFFLLGAAL